MDFTPWIAEARLFALASPVRKRFFESFALFGKPVQSPRLFVPLAPEARAKFATAIRGNRISHGRT
jgi:hypothetical protein